MATKKTTPKSEAKDTGTPPAPARDEGPVHVEDGPVHHPAPGIADEEHARDGLRAEPADGDGFWRDPGTLEVPRRAPRAHGPVPPLPPMPGASWVEDYVRPKHVYQNARPAMLPTKKRRAA